MPEISRFFGIVITMYWHDHPPAPIPSYRVTSDEAAAILGIKWTEAPVVLRFFKVQHWKAGQGYFWDGKEVERVKATVDSFVGSRRTSP
jgi:hypothetical protein